MKRGKVTVAGQPIVAETDGGVAVPDKPVTMSEADRLARELAKLHAKDFDDLSPEAQAMLLRRAQKKIAHTPREQLKLPEPVFGSAEELITSSHQQARQAPPTFSVEALLCEVTTMSNLLHASVIVGATDYVPNGVMVSCARSLAPIDRVCSFYGETLHAALLQLRADLRARVTQLVENATRALVDK